METYQKKLVESLQEISDLEFDPQPFQGFRSIRGILTHMIAARGRWFHNLMSEGGDVSLKLGIIGKNGLKLQERIK